MKAITTRNENLVVKHGEKVAIFSPSGEFYSARTLEFWDYLQAQGLTVEEGVDFKFPDLYTIIEYRGSRAVSNSRVATLGTWEQVKQQFPEASIGTFEYETNDPDEKILQFQKLVCEQVDWDELERLERI